MMSGKGKSTPISDSSPTRSKSKKNEHTRLSSTSADIDSWLESKLEKIKPKSSKSDTKNKSKSKDGEELKRKSLESSTKVKSSGSKDNGLRDNVRSKKHETKNTKEESEEETYEDDYEDYEEDFEEYNEEIEPKDKDKDKGKDRDKDNHKDVDKDKVKQKEHLPVSVKKTDLNTSNKEDLVEEYEGQSSDTEEVGRSVVMPQSTLSPTMDVRAAIAAVDAENAASRPIKSLSSTATTALPVYTKIGARKVVDVRTSKVQQESVRRMARARELSTLITFESIVVDLLDMPPLDEYGKYILYFGRSDCSQQACQTNDVDDRCNKDTQTNPSKSKNRGIQVPGNGQADDNEAKAFDSIKPLDTVNLGRFLSATSAVVESLLEENIGDISKKKFVQQQSEWSSSYINISHSILDKRTAQQIECSAHLPNHVAVLYSGVALPDRTSKSKDFAENLGLICLWNLDYPDAPSNILATYLTPCCMCILSRNILVAGTAEGSVLVWDLREPVSTHNTLQVFTEFPKYIFDSLRFPAYATDGLKEAHNQAVTRIQCIGSNNHSSHTLVDKEQNTSSSGQNSNKPTKRDPLDLLPIYTDEDSGLAFKIASLDESGIVNIWVVIELDPNHSNSIDMDLHVSIGGRVRMVHTARLRSPAVHAFDFALYPLDTSRVLIAGDNGKLVHGTRLVGSRLGMLPQFYQVKSSASDVLVITTHPSLPPDRCSGLILSGCADGFIALHHVEQNVPIRSWELKSKCMGIIWSSTRALQFFVTTQASLFIFDLTKSLDGPIVVHDLKTKRSTSRPSSVATRWSMHGKLLPVMYVGDSAVTVHRVTDKYSVAMNTTEISQVLSKLLDKV